MSTKLKVLQQITRAGDAVITLRKSEKENLETSFLCTVDFSTPYVKKKIKGRFNTGRNVLVFSWTDNTFRLINPKEVKSITNLSTILRNKDNGKESIRA